MDTLNISHRATAAGLFLNQFKSPIIFILLLAMAVMAVVGLIVIDYFFAAEAVNGVFHRGRSNPCPGE